MIRAVTEPDRLILSREVEIEYRDSIFLPTFDRVN